MERELPLSQELVGTTFLSWEEKGLATDHYTLRTGGVLSLYGLGRGELAATINDTDHSEALTELVIRTALVSKPDVSDNEAACLAMGAAALQLRGRDTQAPSYADWIKRTKGDNLSTYLYLYAEERKPLLPRLAGAVSALPMGERVPPVLDVTESWNMPVPSDCSAAELPGLPELKDFSCPRLELPGLSERDRSCLSSRPLAELPLDGFTGVVVAPPAGIKASLPFDPPRHPDAQSRLGRDMLARLEASTREYAQSNNAAEVRGPAYGA
jgi:hypothetical protein